MKEKFIQIYTETITRPGADKLLEWLERGSFFDDPASTRFHLSKPGGLCEHSVHVFERLRALCEMEAKINPGFAVPSVETMAIVGLLHDLCKVGCYHQEPKNRKTYDPQKVRAAQNWQIKHDSMGDFIWETVTGYRYEDPMPYGHGEKSVYIISAFMKLSREEAFAIRYHMGPWRDGEKQNAGDTFSRFPLAALAHIADMEATYLDEVEREDAK
jgi:hypothetical protein